jgi:hypothetical protein
MQLQYIVASLVPGCASRVLYSLLLLLLLELRSMEK